MPSPPIWISSRITTWPVWLKNVAVFSTAKPVTQTALVLVKAASSHEQCAPSTTQRGIFSNSAPSTMTVKNDPISSHPGCTARAVKRVWWWIIEASPETSTATWMNTCQPIGQVPSPGWCWNSSVTATQDTTPASARWLPSRSTLPPPWPEHPENPRPLHKEQMPGGAGDPVLPVHHHPAPAHQRQQTDQPPSRASRGCSTCRQNLSPAS